MSVLIKREVWRKPTPPALPSGKTADLTDEERENVRRALRFLRVRAGSGKKLAAALRMSPCTLTRMMSAKGKPGASVAFKAARTAGVTFEAVIGGTWPGSTCPHCGRGD